MHRELTCQNCLLEEDFTVKISDFGLSFIMQYPVHYSKSKSQRRILRWMAPEVLMHRDFTIKSDV